MSAIRHSPAPVAIGVDVGGTWLRVAASDAGRRTRRHSPAGATLAELGKLLLRVWRKRRWRRDHVGALVVAARGIWTRAERRALARRLRRLARRVVVLSDAQAALIGALNGRAGLLILSGTGSIVVGRDVAGRWHRAGGLGPLLGDEGSAFWLGREWLRSTTLGEDFEPTRALVSGPRAVSRIAALAPAVLQRARAGDRRARPIARDGQRHLATLALDVARRTRLPRPVDVSWAGSVLADPWFRGGLMREIRRRGLSARWRAPAAEPVTAALALARELCGGGRKPGSVGRGAGQPGSHHRGAVGRRGAGRGRAARAITRKR